MSRRNKLEKFAEVLAFTNVYENFNPKNALLTFAEGIEVEMKGKWAKEHFKNDHPITLELACGRGEYSLALAAAYPGRNFIGVDIKGARIWKGAKLALERKLHNVAFLRTRIEQIHQFFAKDEVDEIWITFPDPFLKKENRRLTSPYFLKAYKQFLKGGGKIHLKTDDPTLYAFSVAMLQEDHDIDIAYKNDNIYAGDLYIPELSFKTYYELIHLEEGKNIKYIQSILK